MNLSDKHPLVNESKELSSLDFFYYIDPECPGEPENIISVEEHNHQMDKYQSSVGQTNEGTEEESSTKEPLRFDWTNFGPEYEPAWIPDLDCYDFIRVREKVVKHIEKLRWRKLKFGGIDMYRVCMRPRSERKKKFAKSRLRDTAGRFALRSSEKHEGEL